jgi:hypothetical protein
LNQNFHLGLRPNSKNHKNDFTEEDVLPNLAECSSEELGNDLEKRWKKEERSPLKDHHFSGHHSELCISNYFPQSSTSSKFSPLQFRILFFRVEKLCLIYRKYLKLTKETCQKYTLGQMVNLLSNDVDRFIDAFIPF